MSGKIDTCYGCPKIDNCVVCNFCDIPPNIRCDCCDYVYIGAKSNA